MTDRVFMRAYLERHSIIGQHHCIIIGRKAYGLLPYGLTPYGLAPYALTPYGLTPYCLTQLTISFMQQLGVL